jgi:tricorn protease
MKRLLFFFTLIFLFHSNYLNSQNELFFALDPSLSPDGQTIIFSYDGDLWSVDVKGGQALRITAMDGDETRPNISPDGKWLAFSGTQYGNKDIFIMPMGGGEIKQLTFHESFDDVDSWSWDSKNIFFTSNRYNRFSGFSVNINGNTPKRLFPHYFNNVHNLAEHPVSEDIYFNESWESKNFAHRKRYKGDYNPDIKSYNSNTKQFTQHTNYRGKDFGATIAQNGSLYFKSDEANEEYNLFTFENGSKKQLTKFETSIYWPKVSANGSKIVFRKDYQIFVYDVASNSTTQPQIKLNKNNTLARQQDFNVKGKITDFDVSPDNKKIALISRGELFISDIKGEFVKKVKTNASQAVGQAVWLKDNKTILFTQTVGGYYNLFTIGADKEGAEKQLTHDNQNNRQISFNSDRTQAVYLSGRNEVRIIDLETMASKTIARDELWAMYNPNPYFSPDDRYIMYNVYNDFEQDIMVYDTETSENRNISNTKITESDPFWSPDGKYIYFSSDLLNPGYPYGTNNAHIYRIALDKYGDPFKSDKIEDLFAEKEENDESSEEKDGEDEADEEKEPESETSKKEVQFNFDKLMDRIERISPSFGQQFSPFVIQDADKTIVLYASDHDEGKTFLWKTTIEPFKNNKTEKVHKDEINNYQIVSSDNKYYILLGGTIHTLKAADNKLEKIELSFKFRKRLSDEFYQMFYEAWAGFEENFYNEDFHGQDWQTLRDRYASFIPQINNRSNLRLILNDMLGELNTSHFGFRSNGKEEAIYYGSRTNATGIIFNTSNPFIVDRIITDSPADVKDVDIKEGDRLVSVNSIAVQSGINRESYFSSPSQDAEISLTFERNGEMIKSKIHTASYNAIKNLIYDEWQDRNQAYVDSKSNKQIAYVHMKNMGRGEFNKFKRDIVTEGEYKNGLILDLRYNTGGNVHDDVLRLLSQRPYLKWKYREGEFTQQSNFGPADRPIVLLINEQSLSDAEMTAHGFKHLKLGTVIGTETYRWIIFTSGKGLVDGSFYRLPSWGCYTLDGDNLEKTGVSPDIRIEKKFTDRMEGNYPQLDKAVEVILKELGN